MDRKTVIFLCGLIGSGKTTYAKNNFKCFTDMDYMRPYSRKIDQINWTLQLLEKEDTVCHITCMPTREELMAFKNFDKKFLWMNTTPNQARINILIRSRLRDMVDIGRVLNVNAGYFIRFQHSGSLFKLINNCGRSIEND